MQAELTTERTTSEQITSEIKKDITGVVCALPENDQERIECAISFLGAAWKEEEDWSECILEAVSLECSAADYMRILNVAYELAEKREEINAEEGEKLLALIKGK